MSRRKPPPPPETTGWFSISVRPVRVGVYQVRCPNWSGGVEVRYALWTGKFWCSVSHLVRSAAKQGLESAWMKQPTVQWRGLAQEPKQ